MEAMAPLAHHEETQIRYDLAESIPYLAGEAAGRIGMELLDDPEPTVQLVAAFGLGRVLHQAAAPRLAEILKDTRRDRMVRASCLDALGKMGSPLLLPALEVAVASEPDSATAAGFQMHLDRLRGVKARPR
jgi:HEAT repeat protein